MQKQYSWETAVLFCEIIHSASVFLSVALLYSSSHDNFIHCYKNDSLPLTFRPISEVAFVFITLQLWLR